MSMYGYLEREQQREIEAAWEIDLADAWAEVDLEDYSEGYAESVLRSWMTDEHYHIGTMIPSKVKEWFNDK